MVRTPDVGHDGDMEPVELRRSPADQARIAGVCAGLATTWRVDPLIVRIAFVVLALGGGIGFTLYAVAYALSVGPSGEAAPLDRMLPQWRRWSQRRLTWTIIALCVVTAIVLAPFVPVGLLPSVIVLAMWWVGIERPRRQAVADRQARAAAPASAPVDPQVAAFWSHPDPVGLYAPPQPPAAPLVDPRVRLARRRCVRLAWVGLALMGLAMSAVSVISLRHRLPWVAYPAAALLVIGVMLMVGSQIGRPKGFLALGVIVALITAGGLADHTAATVTQSGHGTAFSSPSDHTKITHEADLPEQITRDVGSIDLDLSQLELTADRSLIVTVDTGSLRVRIPEGTRVAIDYSCDMGSARILDRVTKSGPDISGSVSDPGEGPVLHLTVHSDLGSVEVIR